jgi:tetratricopeptide (TPR) repeat protein
MVISVQQPWLMSAALQSSREPSASPRQLPPEIANEIAAAEKVVTSALSNPAALDVIVAAIPQAERVLNLRRSYQGDAWWETIDARLSLETLRSLKEMSRDDRDGLASVQQTEPEIFRLYQRGQLTEALEKLRTKISILERTLGKAHTDYASSLNDLAIFYSDLGRHADAEQVYREALAIRERVLGKEHPKYADTLNELASAYHEAGRYADAEPLYREALAIRERVLGKKHADYAVSLNNLGGVCAALGRHADAEPFLREALDIRERVLGKENPDYFHTLSNLAGVYEALRRYADAEPLYLEALTIRQRVVGKQHPDYAATQDDLGRVYVGLARYADAEPLFRQALAIRERVFGKEHPRYALSLNNLANVYAELGRYADADSLYREALAIEARALGKEHPDYALGLNNLARLYYKLDRYADAEPLFREALAINERAAGKEHPRYALSLNSLAAVYAELGGYADAEPLYREALAINERVLGILHPDYALGLNNLARLYNKMGRYADAEPLYREALAINERVLGKAHPDYALSLLSLGDLYAKTDQPDSAAKLFLAGMKVQWEFTRLNLSAMSEAQKRQFVAGRVSDGADPIWGLVFQRRLAASYGFQAALLWKQLLFEAARRENGAMRAALASASPSWRQRWDQREQLRRQYATISLKSVRDHEPGPPTGDAATDATLVRDVAMQLETLEQQLRREHPEYAARARLDSLTFDDVSRNIKPTDALLEFVVFNPVDFTLGKYKAPRYGVLVWKTGGATAAIDLGEAAPIDEAVDRYRGAVRASIDDFGPASPSLKQVRESEALIAEASAAVRALVWAPLEKALGDAQRVYVAPDGALSLIPFEALAQATPTGSWRYLVEDRELVYLSTGRDLARLALSRPSVSRTSTAVLIGNPTFEATPQQVAVAMTGAGAPQTARTEHAPGSATLGTVTGGTRRDDVPRHWEPAPQLGSFLTAEQAQLTARGWTVRTFTGLQASEDAVAQVDAPRLLQFATARVCARHAEHRSEPVGQPATSIDVDPGRS